ncbi:MAG: hypothetical protein APG12_01545 [Candidatus Methanofastidiosum methylothiophilum]|jgi:hypothetical protein|uniref:Uncharacterized protein n=1 Tax=Candidatus Methanofastidiosum methylothiophilum TaxID=1705564 RepID=A0A150IWG9_9EURY|nr:MAG: hypothetical protein APG10_01379 [Candidatus Methanofastidiosum methylthiophilus]KYC49349.1 MAG: hypothetical protein APG12_01545 [Candidatus Methanofastidiosum methylthiophilus]
MTTLPLEYIKIINENISKSESIINFFGEDWLNKQIYTEEKDYHPIIVVLSDLEEINKLTSNLEVLKKKCSKFPRMIRKLKSDKANFFPNLSEIDVVSYYYRNHDQENLEYEPSVEGGKNLDLMLKGKKDVKYYFEIFTVFEDAIQQKHRDIMGDIGLAIGKLNLPYVINFRITEDFKSSYIPDFIDFVKDSLNRNNLNIDQIKFYKDGTEVAEFNIKPSAIRGVTNSFGPPRFINPIERIKKKILDKSNEQIPDNQNSILVINLSYGVPIIFLAVKEALKLIEYPENITIIIAYFGNNYENNKKCYPNPNLNKPALNDIIHDIT